MSVETQDIPRFVLTGGPCAGKTSGMATLNERLANIGHTMFTCHEAATSLIQGGISPQNVGIDNFQRFTFERTLHYEQAAYKAAKMHLDKKPIIICDRGLPDNRAYMEQDLYELLLKESDVGTAEEVRDARYHGVFHMRTAALGAEEFYTLENNAARYETPQQARDVDNRILQAWQGAPHVSIIDNAGDFETKLDTLWQSMCHTLGLPIPLEIENRYELDPNFNPSDIPIHYEEIDIEQVYLYTNEEGRRRVRKRGQNGSFTYFETLKRRVRSGVSAEYEHLIYGRDYDRSIRHIDPKTAIVRKKRHYFVYDNQYFELDMYENPLIPPRLEIELTKENSSVNLPPWIESKVQREITHEDNMSNYDIACMLKNAA